MPLTPEQLAARAATVSSNQQALKTGAPVTDVRSITSNENPAAGTQGPSVVPPPTAPVADTIPYTPPKTTMETAMENTFGPKQVGVNVHADGTPMTTQEQAVVRANGTYQDTKNTATGLFGDATVTQPQNLPDYYKQQDQQTADQIAFQKSQNAAANQNDEYGLKRSIAGAQAGIAGTTATLSPGREGVVSGTRGSMINEYRTTINGDIAQNVANYNAAKAARDNNIKLAEEARANGQIKLAETYEAQVASAQAKIEEAQRANLDLQNKSTQLALDVGRFDNEKRKDAVAQMNWSIEHGVQFTPQMIADLTESTGLSYADIQGYSEAAAVIMADKKLSNEEKKIAIDDKKVELQRKIDGTDDVTIRRIKALDERTKEWIASGMSQEEAMANRAEYASLLGLKSTQDPMYQAQLDEQELTNKIAQMDASGDIPVGSAKWWEREQLKANVEKIRAENAEKLGVTAGDAASTTIGDKSVATLVSNAVSSADAKHKKAIAEGKIFECVGFARDATGGTMPRAGNTYQSKMQNLIQSPTSGSGHAGWAPKVGSVFVMDLGPNGHVGVVTNVDGNGFDFTDYNRAGPYQVGNGHVDKDSATAKKIGGFWYPDKLSSSAGATGDVAAVVRSSKGKKALTDTATKMLKDAPPLVGELDRLRKIIENPSEGGYPEFQGNAAMSYGQEFWNKLSKNPKYQELTSLLESIARPLGKVLSQDERISDADARAYAANDVPNLMKDTKESALSKIDTALRRLAENYNSLLKTYGSTYDVSSFTPMAVEADTQSKK